MMRIDKKEDLYILNAMGLRPKRTLEIFRWEAFFVAGLGTFLGLFLGIILIILQQKFGLITTQATFEMVYPVSLRLKDVVLVLLLNTSLGFLVSMGNWGVSRKV